MTLNKFKTHTHTQQYSAVLQAIIIAVYFCPSSIYRIYPKHSVASSSYTPFLKLEHVQFTTRSCVQKCWISVDAAETLDSAVSSGSILFKQTSVRIHTVDNTKICWIIGNCGRR